MKNIPALIAILVITGLLACSKHKAEKTSIIGKWVCTDFLGNDYWGGPGYWKKPKDNGLQLDFTTDGKFSRKYHDNVIYAGDFTVLSDTSVQLTVTNIPQIGNVTSISYYRLTGGQLTWYTGMTEGSMIEKYEPGE